MKQLVELFKALADESRLRILNLLVNAGELCVCDIQKILRFSQPKVSRHLTYLKHAGLVRDRREGLWVVYSFVGLQDESRRRLMKELKDVFDLISFAVEYPHDTDHRKKSAPVVGQDSLNNRPFIEVWKIGFHRG